jgi:hypothetical protein
MKTAKNIGENRNGGSQQRSNVASKCSKLKLWQMAAKSGNQRRKKRKSASKSVAAKSVKAYQQKRIWSAKKHQRKSAMTAAAGSETEKKIISARCAGWHRNNGGVMKIWR